MILGLGGFPREGSATHSSILAWRIPWAEEPGGLQSTGSQRVGHDRATFPHKVTCIQGHSKFLNNIGISSNLAVYSLTLLKCFSSLLLFSPSPTYSSVSAYVVQSLITKLVSLSLVMKASLTTLATVSLSPSLRLVIHFIPTIYFHIAPCYFSSVFTYICPIFPIKL